MTPETIHRMRGWRPASSVSLPEVHGSIAVPAGAGFWRKMFAFAGPGYLVAVGYMDPGNWATDLAGGARYGYTLLSVIMLSNLMAILLQALAAAARHRQRPRSRAGVPRQLFATRRHRVVDPVRDRHRRLRSGRSHRLAAIALNLLFGLPLIWGVCLTALDVLIVLVPAAQGASATSRRWSSRSSSLIAGSFAVELWLSKPAMGPVALGFIPAPEILRNSNMLYIAIGILGATVMPHNLYLHSSIVQTRKYLDTPEAGGGHPLRVHRFGRSR